MPKIEEMKSDRQAIKSEEQETAYVRKVQKDN